METDWEQRYQQKDVPWDKGAPSPGLVDFLAAHPELPRGQVCVPGCGMGHDVRVWAGAGFAATGVDIAPSAVRAAAAKAGAEGWSIPFRAGDFLSDPPFQAFDWVFEHTFFCAIAPARRVDYVRAMRRWIRPGGYLLAIHYMIPDTEGPPFGTTREELMDRFTPHFELLEEKVPRSYEHRTGLELLLWWRRRPEDGVVAE